MASDGHPVGNQCDGHPFEFFHHPIMVSPAWPGKITRNQPTFDFCLALDSRMSKKKTSGSKNPAVFSVFPGTGNIPPLRHVHQLAQLALCESPKVAVSLVFWVAELFGNGPGSPVVIGPKNWSEVIWKRKRTVEILTGWCFQPIFGMIIPNIGEKNMFQTTNQLKILF